MRNRVILLKKTMLAPNLKVYYPQVVKHRSRKVQNRINRCIYKNLRSLIKQTNYGEKEVKVEVAGDYKIHLNGKNLLSLTLEVYFYYEKAAHGMTLRQSLTFNTRNGYLYQLRDLFKTGSNYIGRINKYVKCYFKRKDIPLLTEFKTIQPNQSFYLTPKRLVIYFAIYEYTPYVFGFPEVPIPFVYLKDIANPYGPIAILEKP